MTEARVLDRKAAASPSFVRIVFKRLSAVEADPARSNQHEFNGTKALQVAFGQKPRRIRTDFVWMSDDGDWTAAEDMLTWYDARAMHPTRTEYRLYYRSNPVTLRAAAGDILLLALRSDRTALALVAPGSGVAAAKIFWLFGIEVAPGAGFAALDLNPAAQQAIAERLGITARSVDDGWSSEEHAQAAKGDRGLRDRTALVQRLVGIGPDAYAADQENDWLPESVPEVRGAQR